MTELPLPVQFLAWIGTWIARHQRRTISYLKEENGVLLERLGGRRTPTVGSFGVSVSAASSAFLPPSRRASR
jgi:hypothetical protein